MVFHSCSQARSHCLHSKSALYCINVQIHFCDTFTLNWRYFDLRWNPVSVMSSVANKAKAKATFLKTKTSYHKENANAPSHKADDWNIEWTTQRFNNVNISNQTSRLSVIRARCGLTSKPRWENVLHGHWSCWAYKSRSNSLCRSLYCDILISCISGVSSATNSSKLMCYSLSAVCQESRGRLYDTIR